VAALECGDDLISVPPKTILIAGWQTLYGERRFVIECPAPSTTISCYEKLDHLHFGPLFSGDDAGFVQ